MTRSLMLRMLGGIVVLGAVALAPIGVALGGQVVTVSPVDRLIGTLQYDRHDGNREKAAKELGRFGDPAAVPALCSALLGDKKDDVREAAADALGRIADAGALPSLRQAAAYDREGDVRKAARRALDVIDPPRPVVVQQPTRVTVIERPAVTYVAPPPVTYYVAPPTVTYVTPPPVVYTETYVVRPYYYDFYPRTSIGFGYRSGGHWGVGFSFRR